MPKSWPPLALLLAAALLVASCGGRTREPPQGVASGGKGSAGAGGKPSEQACEATDADCYAAAGIDQSCSAHADCKLSWRSCCPGCSEPSAAELVALNQTSRSLVEAGVCSGASASAGCDDCLPPTNPRLYPACVEGWCRVLDVSAHASCTRGHECQLVTKDCCDCGGDYSLEGVMSVNLSHPGHAHCVGVGCDGCLSPGPMGPMPFCSARGLCGILDYHIQ
ncbi:MAG TPA: hypothetical protein VIW29_16230 [Polyangiaceae bacterium]